MSAAACPACGRAVPAGRGRWRVCPHCREAFEPNAGDPAGPIPVPVVFEEIEENQPPAPEPEPPGPASRKPRPVAAQRTAKRPAAVRPRPSSGPTTAGSDLFDSSLVRQIEESPTVDPPRAATPKPEPSRRRKRRRPRSRRDWPVLVGTGMFVLLVAGLVVSEVGATAAKLAAGQSLGIGGFLRPLISLLVVVKLWGGSTVTRAVWCGVCWFAAAGLVAAAHFLAPPAQFGNLMGAAAAVAITSLLLTAYLYSPCFSAFLAHRLGER